MLTKFTSILPKLPSNFHPFSSIFSVGVRNSSCCPSKDFTIETTKDSEREKIVSFINRHYLKNKPLAKALIPGQEPEKFTNLIREAVCQNMSVVAKRTCGDCNIIGACINDRSTSCDAVKLEQIANSIKGCNLRKFMQTKALVTKASDVNTKLCNPDVFHVGTVSVCKNHWGKGIGLEMIKKSLKLAALYNFKYAKMTCMCENTKELAKNVGMKEIWSAPYKDILCFYGDAPRAYPDCPHTKAYVYYIDLCPPSCCPP